MNLFKGPLFLHGDIIPRPETFGGERPRYGAATVADQLDHKLGNAAARRRWLGGPSASKLPQAVCCLDGGCA